MNLLSFFQTGRQALRKTGGTDLFLGFADRVLNPDDFQLSRLIIKYRERCSGVTIPGLANTSNINQILLLPGERKFCLNNVIDPLFILLKNSRAVRMSEEAELFG